MNAIRQMHAALVKEKLRHAAQEALSSLIAADVTEEDARIATLNALQMLHTEWTEEWGDKNWRAR